MLNVEHLKDRPFLYATDIKKAANQYGYSYRSDKGPFSDWIDKNPGDYEFFHNYPYLEIAKSLNTHFNSDTMSVRQKLILEYKLNPMDFEDSIEWFVAEYNDDKQKVEEIKARILEKDFRRMQSFVDEVEIAELQPAQTKFTANFNYKPLLAKYDVAAIAKSPIKYFDAVLNVTDELFAALQEYETAQAETIEAFLKIALKLKAKYTDNPNLTPEENALLAERQQFLATRLELGTDEPKRKTLNVKEQAYSFFARLDKISGDNNSIRALAELQAEPRADFELLVETLARIILDAQRKVDFFVGHKDFVAAVAKAHTEWSDDYKAFKTSLREELAADCRNEKIDEEIFSAWYDDWQVQRFAIEQRFLPLIEFALKGNFSDAVPQTLDILRNYRDAVDKFYLHERKSIYLRFADKAGGSLQDKFETENELYNLAEKFQRDLQEIIFKRDKTEERVFLLRWAEPLLHLPLDEISNFIRDRELDAIAEEVLNQFAELRRQNFEQYLADSKSYGESVQKRESEFNALIFRMRKDLHAK